MKSNKGITLVMLIITIIILLILTGVTIATLTGENGLLERAENAKTVTNRERAKEKVILAVMASWDVEGKINKSLLKENLKKIEGITGNPEDENFEYPLEVVVDGYKISISEEGKITVGNAPESDGNTNEGVSAIVQAIIANPEAYYGKKVTNYNVGDGRTYRIFYVDTENKFGDGKNTVYLKADPCDSRTLPTPTVDEDTNTDYLARYNPQWWAARGASMSSWNINEKAAAWLCNPTNFEEKYKDKTGELASSVKAVTGAPSVEMYIESYNTVPHKGKSKIKITYCQNESVHGYFYQPCHPNVEKKVEKDGEWYGPYTVINLLDNIDYYKIYTENCYWWLASPSASNSAYVCFVDGSNARVGNNYYNATHALTPLVSLKPDAKLAISETE